METGHLDVLMEIVRHVPLRELLRVRLATKALRAAVAASTLDVEWYADPQSLPAKLAAFPHASVWRVVILPTSRRPLYEAALQQLSAAATASLRASIRVLRLQGRAACAAPGSAALNVGGLASRFPHLQALSLHGRFEPAVYDTLYAQLPGPLGGRLTQLHINLGMSAASMASVAGGRWVLRPADLQAVATCCGRLQELTLTWPNLEDDAVAPWCDGLQALGRLASLTQLSLTGAPLCHLPEFASGLGSALAALTALSSLSLSIAECTHAHETGSAAMWSGGQEEFGCGVWVGVWARAPALRSLALSTDCVTQGLYDDLMALTRLTSLRLTHTTWALDFNLQPTAGLMPLPGLKALELPLGDAQLGILAAIAPHLTSLSLNLRGLSYSAGVAHSMSGSAQAMQTQNGDPLQGDVVSMQQHGSVLTAGTVLTTTTGGEVAEAESNSPTTSSPSSSSDMGLAALVLTSPRAGAPLVALAALTGLRSLSLVSRHMGLTREVVAGCAAACRHLTHLSFTGIIEHGAPGALSALSRLNVLALLHTPATERVRVPGSGSGGGGGALPAALAASELPVIDVHCLPCGLQKLELERVRVVSGQRQGQAQVDAPAAGAAHAEAGLPSEDRALRSLDTLRLDNCRVECALEQHMGTPLAVLMLSSCTVPPGAHGPEAMRALVHTAPFLHTLHVLGPAGGGGAGGVAGLDTRELRELSMTLRVPSLPDLVTLFSLTQLRSLVLETGSAEGLQGLTALTHLRHLSVTLISAFDSNHMFGSGMGRAVMRERLQLSLQEGLPRTEVVCAVR